MNRRKAIIGIAMFGFCAAARASSITTRKSPELKAKENRDPKDGWDKLTRWQRFQIMCNYEIAKLSIPGLTVPQYKNQIKTIWQNTQ